MQSLSEGTPTPSAPEWYAVFTATRHEKRIAEHLSFREIECFLPTYEVVRRWKNRTTPRVELPLFPNYLFARIGRSQRVDVLSVQGVRAVVGSGRVVTPIPERYIEALKAGVASGTAQPHPYLTVGQRVRITSGAMQGIEGFLSEVRGAHRFVLSLELIHQSVSVEVGADTLELVR